MTDIVNYSVLAASFLAGFLVSLPVWLWAKKAALDAVRSEKESLALLENTRLGGQIRQKVLEIQKLHKDYIEAQEKIRRLREETEEAGRHLNTLRHELEHEYRMVTVGRLAASLGHEVNNPLTILSMNISRAILRHRKNPNVKVEEILDIFDKMQKNVERIRAVVTTLTGLLKKSESGKWQALSLRQILEETLPLVQYQTHGTDMSGTEVALDIPEDLPQIGGDFERLQEVFLNLLTNACHAVAGRRNRRIKVSACLLDTQRHFLHIDISDNGCGMNEETQKRIFQYGFTTKPPGRGSGMGLYIAKYILELHGGSIQAQSRKDIGTTFTLTLPTFEARSNLKEHFKQEVMISA